ncbi:MAG: DUF3592 domain-containing protein [Magnetococcales bacterium]|nr:DUF3592 domain-containing protein [Magnetococcales bacterium]
MVRPLFNAVNTMAMTLGLAFLILGITPFVQSQSSDAWYAGDGVIVSSELMPGTTLFGWVLTHRVRVVYRYKTRNGKHFDSSHLEFGIGGHSYLIRSFAERVVHRYPEGKPIRAYYNPGQPNSAVLERGPSMGGSMIWMVFGVLFLGASVFIRFPESE